MNNNNNNNKEYYGNLFWDNLDNEPNIEVFLNILQEHDLVQQAKFAAIIKLVDIQGQTTVNEAKFKQLKDAIAEYIVTYRHNISGAEFKTLQEIKLAIQAKLKTSTLPLTMVTQPIVISEADAAKVEVYLNRVRARNNEQTNVLNKLFESSN